MTGAIRIGSTSLRSVFNYVKYFVRTLHVLTVAHQPKNKRKLVIERSRNAPTVYDISAVHFDKLTLGGCPKSTDSPDYF